MDIKQMRYVIAIAEEGSLSAASVKLGVAQRSLIPTPATHAVRPRARLVPGDPQRP